MTRSIAPTEWNRSPDAQMCTILEGLKLAARSQYPIRALTMQNPEPEVVQTDDSDVRVPDQLLIDIENPRFIPLAEVHSPDLGKAALKCLIHIGDASRLYGIVSLSDEAKHSYRLVGFPKSEDPPETEVSRELKPHYLQRLPFSADINPDELDRRLTIMPIGHTVDALLLTYNGAGYADIFAVERHEGRPLNLVDPQLWVPSPSHMESKQ